MNIEKMTRQVLLSQNFKELRKYITNGNAVVVENFFNHEVIDFLLMETHKCSRTRTMEWQPVNDSVVNHSRCVSPNKQSYVLQKCRRTTFYLWNHDSREILEKFADIFDLKFKFSNSEKKIPIELMTPSKGKYGQISVNHYPKGGGFMNAHKDSEKSYGEIHILINGSSRGEDFYHGGVYFINDDGVKVDVEQYWSKGDILLFDASRIWHGVDPVDSSEQFDWSEQQGRYTFSPVLIEIMDGGVLENSVEYKGAE